MNRTLKFRTKLWNVLNLNQKEIYNTLISFTQGEQKAYLDWVYEAKTETTKVKRIVEIMNRPQKN